MAFWSTAFKFLNDRDIAKRTDKKDKAISIANINATRDLKIATVNAASRQAIPNQAKPGPSTPPKSGSILSGTGSIITGGIAVAIGVVVIMFMRFAKAS